MASCSEDNSSFDDVNQDDFMLVKVNDLDKDSVNIRYRDDDLIKKSHQFGVSSIVGGESEILQIQRESAEL